MPEVELQNVAPRQNGGARAGKRESASEAARWRELCANAPGVIVLLTRDGRVVALSGALFSREPSEWVGRALAPTLSGEAGRAIDGALEQLRTAQTDGETSAIELELTLEGERARTHRVRLMSLQGEQRGQAAFSAFVTDISERAASEQALRESEALLCRRQKAAQLAFMAGGVAHDFNNLLTVIVGAADLLGEEAPPGSVQRGELLQIQRAGERATEITRQLLAFSRREPSLPRRVDLAARVLELQGLWRHMLGANTHFELTRTADLWAVWCDPLHAEHVLTHLVLNARQAMPRGGVLGVTLSNRAIASFESHGGVMVGAGQYVELRVSDTGPGWSPAALAVAFEPFFSARQGEVPTDLSLPLVRSLVVQSLGHVWAESEPGHGTTLVVLWPRSRRGRSGARKT
jgi:two-component system, cell cycle sensor histidine kinase and response regulator CckA